MFLCEDDAGVLCFSVRRMMQVYVFLCEDDAGVLCFSVRMMQVCCVSL